MFQNNKKSNKILYKLLYTRTSFARFHCYFLPMRTAVLYISTGLFIKWKSSSPSYIVYNTIFCDISHLFIFCYHFHSSSRSRSSRHYQFCSDSKWWLSAEQVCHSENMARNTLAFQSIEMAQCMQLTRKWYKMAQWWPQFFIFTALLIVTNIILLC